MDHGVHYCTASAAAAVFLHISGGVVAETDTELHRLSQNVSYNLTQLVSETFRPTHISSVLLRIQNISL